MRGGREPRRVPLDVGAEGYHLAVCTMSSGDATWQDELVVRTDVIGCGLAPEIVSVDTFTQVQLMRRSRAAGGMRGRGKLDRRTFTTSRPYRLRGRFRCTLCERKMLAATIRNTIYYRCLARTIAPGSPVLTAHPRTVNVREDHVNDPLNDWIMQAYDRDHINQTVAAIVAANPRLIAARSQRTRAVAKLKDADKRLRRHRAAIEAGVNPVALVEPINAAEAEGAAAKAELENLPEPSQVTAAEIYARIDMIGELGTSLSSAQPERLNKLYDAIGLELRYAPDEQRVHVSTTLRVANECVRGGT